MFRKAWRNRTRIGCQKEAGSKLGYGPLEWPMSIIADMFIDDVDVLNRNLILIQSSDLVSEPVSFLPPFV